MTTAASGPPEAPRRPHEHSAHGVVRPDPYHWLREVGSPEVVAHLAAERRWYEAVIGHRASLIEDLRSEMVHRTPAAESSVRCERRHFSYYTRVPTGREHPQLLRDFNTSRADSATFPYPNRNLSNDSGVETQVLLDASDLAGDSAYVELGLTAVSPDERFLAYSYDVRGDEVYRLRFRDLTTGEDLDDEVPRTYYGGAWGQGSDTFLYTVHDDSYRPFQVWQHRIGTPADGDRLVLEEDDPRFELRLRQCRSGRLAVLWAVSPSCTEVWTLDLTQHDAPARSVGGRREGVRYHAEHAVLPDGDDLLLVVTDEGARESRMMTAPVPQDGAATHRAWRELVPHDPAVRLERADAFASHVVLSVRTEGERRLRVVALDDLLSGDAAARGRELRPRFPTGTVHLGANPLPDTGHVVVADGSYVHPWVWSSLDLRTGERTDIHHQEAPGHRPEAYVCERRELAAPDGVAVPATLVRRRDTPLDGSAPALLYAYGAYEAVFEPEWDAGLPSLLDRGVVFVHAHVRGGGEGGRGWYLDGRLDRKQNTFSDLVAVADGLAQQRIVDGSRLATRGLSAGGLLQGAVFSQRPERWRAVVAEVPFVDVVTTMFDATVPLTPQEWGEWGDPRREEDFRWMLAYSPYDNPPPAGGRPDLLVTGAVHDPRVLVGEPAKWVALLRHTDPEWARRCLFRVETGEGAHTGPSGRFAHLGYEAEVQAWLLDRLLH